MELKPTDIHYLVGCLVQSDDGRDIEVELGDMVYDEAAEKERDVDITITRKNELGQLEVFHGLEVKDHSKPLGVNHIEQLCAKMTDMPLLTKKSIVSASGFSKAAKLKAQKHGVELLELVEWTDTREGFDFFKTPKEMIRFADTKSEWQHWEIKSSLDAITEQLTAGGIGPDPIIFSDDGSTFPDVNCFSDFTKTIPYKFKAQWSNTPKGQAVHEAGLHQINININPDRTPYFYLNGIKMPITDITICGVINHTRIYHTGVFKLLRRVGEKIPLSGCGIFISEAGHLGGLSVSNIDKKHKMFAIPFEDRLKNRIFKEKLKKH
jgi:hypothetical protein